MLGSGKLYQVLNTFCAPRNRIGNKVGVMAIVILKVVDEAKAGRRAGVSTLHKQYKLMYRGKGL